MSEPNIDQRPKRLLSSESVNLPNSSKLDKRQRHNSLLIVNDLQDNQIAMDENELPEPDLRKWMARISAQLELAASKTVIVGLATKQDLDKMNDQIVAQGQEIKQIREEIDQYKKDFDSLRLSVDQAEPLKLKRSYETTDRMRSGLNVNNMADRTRREPTRHATTRRNLVIEGLKGNNDDEMISHLIRLATEIGATLFKTDIESIFRIGRRDGSNKTPGPVSVCFTRISIRDNILKKKFNLRQVEGMSDVYVNPDEPVEVRRAKAILRKTAANAKRAGEDVELRYDYVKIGEVTYTLDELHKLPEKYRPVDNRREDREEGLDQACGGVDTAMDTEIPTTNERRERYAIARRRINPANEQKTPDLILPGERMRITTSGLVFSGPTAFPSNLYKAPIRYQEKDYNCNEQVYQCSKAEKHDMNELASVMKEMTESYDIKEEASNIEVSDAWNDQAPEFLWELFDLKMKQNPQLLERLIQTAPLQLIEGSKSQRWGGRAPFHSKLYDNGKFPGKNIFGKTATNYRDMKIKERESIAKEGH